MLPKVKFALPPQVILVVAESLADSLRKSSMLDMESSVLRVWFPAKKINVMFELRKLLVLAASIERVRHDIPAEH